MIHFYHTLWRCRFTREELLFFMSYVKDVIKAVADKRGRPRKKTFLVLLCDHCGAAFEQGNNIAVIRSRPRHFCSQLHHSLAMKNGGISDASRRATCQEKYGVPHCLVRPDVLISNAAASQTPSAKEKRRATMKRMMQDLSFHLKRGLTLPRSRAEVAFLEALSRLLEDEFEVQKHINGWWIDAYSPKWRCWIQFDGVYWHSKPAAAARDASQNEWFAARGFRLIRVTDEDVRSNPNILIDTADRIRQLDAQNC